MLGDAAALDDPSYEGWPAGLAVPSRVLGNAPFVVDVAGHHEGSLVQVTAPDRHGLLADLAGALSVAGQQIRSARLVERDGMTTSIWEVAGRDVDEARLVRRIRQVLDGQLSLDDRLAPSGEGPTEPLQVMLHHDSSTSAVVEVRAQDQRGLVWAVARTITEEGHGIRSAHLSTFGPQARDVFYVVDGAGGPLSAERTDALVERLRELPL